MSEDHQQLVAAACAAREHSYSPYSGYRVGAALRGASGRVYLGTNVENASLGLSICAERVAVGKAVSEGETVFEAIAICGDAAEPTPPCGACRQFLLEFAPELTVVLAGSAGTGGEVLTFSLSELVPQPFRDFRE